MLVFSSSGEWGLLFSGSAWAARLSGVPCGAGPQGAQARAVREPGLSMGPAVAHGLSLVAPGTWDLPRLGIESVSPALVGRFFFYH